MQDITNCFNNTINTDEIFIQSFDKNHNDEVISTSKSNISKKSEKEKQIVENLTELSIKRLKKINKKFSDSKSAHLLKRELNDLDLKSKSPHIFIQASCLDKIKNGWLLKKFDFNSKNKMILNNYSSLALINYDTNSLKFSINQELVNNERIFNSFCFNDLSDNLLIYDVFKSDTFNLIDYEKKEIIQEIYKISNHPTTALICKNNLLLQGTDHNELAIYDIRSSENIFNNCENLDNKNFSPILKIQAKENYFISSEKDKIKIYDIRKMENFLKIKTKKTLEHQKGITLHHFWKDKKIFHTNIGSKILNLYDLKTGEKKEFNLQRKILTFEINQKTNEIITLEGSNHLQLVFYSLKNGILKITDKIQPHQDCFTFEFNKDYSSIISVGSKAISVYNFTFFKNILKR